MSKYLRQTLDCLLFSNIFIAFCAVAQALVTYRLLDAKPDTTILAILFCSTLALYNFSILLPKPENPKTSPFRRVRWIFSHYRLNATLTIIATFSLMLLALFLSIPSFALLSFLGLISVAYNLPIFRFGNRRFGLRNLPGGVKLFLIAFVWSLSCVLLPIVELENTQAFDFPTRDVVLLAVHEFLFMAAITVPFDIRDLFQDKQNSLQTLPILLGEKRAVLLCYGFLLLYLVLLFLPIHPFNRWNAAGLILSICLSAWVIFKSNPSRNEYFYFLFLDGMMIAQLLILLAMNTLV